MAAAKPLIEKAAGELFNSGANNAAPSSQAPGGSAGQALASTALSALTSAVLK
jgi:hypothetical protein